MRKEGSKCHKPVRDEEAEKKLKAKYGDQLKTKK